MNRDKLKLRKDPIIPPSAATVTTSNTNAFSVSPRLGSNTGTNAAHSNGGNNGRGSGNDGREGQGPGGPREGGGGGGGGGVGGGGGGGGGGRRHRNSPNSGSGSTSGSGSGSGLGMIAPGMGIGLGGLGGNNLSSGSKGNNSNYSSNSNNNTSSGSKGNNNNYSSNSNINTLHTGSRAGGSAGGAGGAGGAGVATTLFSSEGSSKPPNTYKFDTNGTLWALSASPDFSMVAVVGRDGELKTCLFFVDKRGMKVLRNTHKSNHTSLILIRSSQDSQCIRQLGRRDCESQDSGHQEQFCRKYGCQMGSNNGSRRKDCDPGNQRSYCHLGCRHTEQDW